MAKLREKKPFTLNQQGFTMIELMIALVIGLALMAGIFSVFLMTKETQNFTTAMSRVQDSARFSLDYLKQDIRMIGYRGCISFDDPKVTINIRDMPAAYVASENELVGFEIAANPLNTALYGNADNIKDIIKNGTDAFSIARMGDSHALLSTTMTSAINDIQLVGNPGLQDDDVAFISDCASADIFKVSSAPVEDAGIVTITHGVANNITNSLSRGYFEDATVSRYQSRLYFIGDTERTNSAGDTIYSLFQATNNFDAASPSFDIVEIIEGVENMQILYGEVIGSGNVIFRKANAVVDMTKVAAIQLALLVSSQQSVRKSVDSTTYQMPGQEVAPGNDLDNSDHPEDRRLRYLVSSTIKIRNRQLIQ